MPQNANTDNFKDVYIVYFSKMKRFAKEYVIREEDAENIVQDVFTELWKHWDTLSTRTNLFAFLFVSVKNRCIDFLRHQSTKQKAERELADEYLFLVKANYESLEKLQANFFSLDDTERIINEAINSLPEKCREIFIKNKIEGKKQKQIAEELNISINTVESQMAIAYKKLRLMLKEMIPIYIFIYFL